MDNCKFIRGINKVDLKKIVASAGFKTENYTTEDFVDHYVYVGLKDIDKEDKIILEISEGKSDTNIYTNKKIEINDFGVVVDKNDYSVGKEFLMYNREIQNMTKISCNDEKIKKLDLAIKEYVKQYAESEEQANI